MITTVVAAAAAASIVLVLVHLSLADLRSAAAQEETAAARSAASDAIAEVATELSVEPSYWAEQVHPRERARVCVAQALAPVIQPGSKWPAECGAAWTYTDPTEAAVARVEITPPSPERRELVVTAVGRSGDTLAARAATFAQPTAGAWTMMSMSDLDVDDVERVSSERTIRGASLYTAGNLALPQGPAALDRSIAVAEGEVTGFGTVAVEDPEHPEEPPTVYPTSGSNRLYASTLSPIISDVRDLVAAPFTLGQLRASTEVARLSVCRGVDARVATIGGADRSTHMCLRRSVRLQDVTGAMVRVPTDTEAYLLITKVVSGEARVAVYTSGSAPAPASSGNLRSNAAGQVAAGTHPGVASASMWRHLGDFDLPATGVISTDRDVYLGACGTGFVSGGSCDTQAGSTGPGMATAEPVTVIAGSDAQPRDIYIGSPIHGQGGLLGAVAFGKVHVAYWARPALGTLDLDVAVAALGADDGLPGFRQFPYDTNPGGQNRGGSLIVTGSVTDSKLDLTPMTQFDQTVVEPSESTPPPHFPATRRLWVDTADRPASLTEVCGSADCAGWLGGGDASGGSGDVTPPAVPGPLTVTAGSGSAQVSWAHVDDAELYRVFWSRTSGGTEFASEVAASNCSTTCVATLDGLTNGVRYRVAVDGTDDAGNTSARSGAVEFVPDGLPNTPTDLAAFAAGPERIQLEWNRATSGPRPTGFRVYRDGVLVAQTPNEFWVDHAASPGATHTYRVRAINDAGESSLSDPIDVLVMAGRPIELTAEGGEGEIELSWTTSPGTVDGYRIYRSTSSAWPGEGGLIETLDGAATGYTDDGLSDGVRYWYWVSAFNDSGESPPAKASMPTLPSAIGDLVAVPVEGVGGRIAASWSAPAGQEVPTFRVYRAGVLVWEGEGTSVNLDGIDPSIEVAYTVRPVNDAGEGPVSNAPTARPVPHTPATQTISTSGTSYSGSFSASTGATSYTVQVQRRGAPGSETTHAATVQAGTSFSANPSLTSTQYRVRVRATNPSGSSSYSEWSQWTAYTTPTAPTINSAWVCGNGYQYCVSWPAVPGAENYPVERHIGNIESWHTAPGGYANNGPTGYYDSQAPKSHPALASDSKASGSGWLGFVNKYRVRACNSNGCSGYSNHAEVFANLPHANDAPSFSQAHRVHGASFAQVPWRVGIPNGWSPGVTSYLEWGPGIVMYATHGTNPGAYPDQVITIIRGSVRIPRYGCYSFWVASDDGSQFIWESAHFGGTPVDALGFDGRVLWDSTASAGAGWYSAPANAIATNACVWLPPNDYRFHLRGDEQEGNAQLNIAWRMQGGHEPWAYKQISNAWVRRDPSVP